MVRYLAIIPFEKPVEFFSDRLKISMMLQPALTEPSRCALCERAAPLTQHHLIPKRLHRNRRLLRQYGRTALLSQIAWLCMPCHKHIHRCLSERELGLHYASVEALLSHPDVREFVSWLQTKPDQFTPTLSRTKRSR